MGTNYYWTPPKCDHCGRDDGARHVGKSSFGWRFTLHVYDDVPDLAAWIAKFNEPGSTLKDEYGRDVTSVQLFDLIYAKRDGKRDSRTAEPNADYDALNRDFS